MADRTEQQIALKPVALQTRVGGIDLQLAGGELGGFLLFSIELFQAGLEAGGEVKFHDPSDSGPVDQGEPFNTSKLTNVVADQGGTKGKAVAGNPEIVAANRSAKAL